MKQLSAIPIVLFAIAMFTAATTNGCQSATGPTPKQQAAIANDAFVVAENVLTAAVQANLITPAENTRLIRPAVLAVRADLDILNRYVSKTPPDSGWKVALDVVNADLPTVLTYAKLAQAKTNPTIAPHP